VKIKLVVIYVSLALAILLAYGPVRSKTTPESQNDSSLTATTTQQEIRPSPTPEPTQVWINVFVHGIMSIKPHLNMSNFMRFMRDDVENTTYAKTVELMRQDNHFFKNQAMQSFGLQKIDPTDISIGNASSALAAILDEVTLMSHGPSIKNHYYTYGWSGLMSHTKRYKDAIILYQDIEKEVKIFQAQDPCIRIQPWWQCGA